MRIFIVFLCFRVFPGNKNTLPSRNWDESAEYTSWCHPSSAAYAALYPLSAGVRCDFGNAALYACSGDVFSRTEPDAFSRGILSVDSKSKILFLHRRTMQFRSVLRWKTKKSESGVGGIDDLAPCQVAPLQTLDQHLGRCHIGGHRNAV